MTASFLYVVHRKAGGNGLNDVAAFRSLRPSLLLHIFVGTELSADDLVEWPLDGNVRFRQGDSARPGSLVGVSPRALWDQAPFKGD